MLCFSGVPQHTQLYGCFQKVQVLFNQAWITISCLLFQTYGS